MESQEGAGSTIVIYIRNPFFWAMNSLATGAVGALLLLGILVCGCTTAPEEGGTVTGAVWVLNGYSDENGAMVAPLASAPVTAEFSDGRLEGSSGCNSYGASYTTSG